VDSVYGHFDAQATERTRSAYERDLSGAAKWITATRGDGDQICLDQVLTNKVGDRGDFRQKLSALQASDFISGKQKDILYRIIDAGSGSVHRGWRPSDLDIGVLLDITENIIETIYLHDARSEAVHKKVPKRVTRDRPIPGAEKTYHSHVRHSK